MLLLLAVIFAILAVPVSLDRIKNKDDSLIAETHTEVSAQIKVLRADLTGAVQQFTLAAVLGLLWRAIVQFIKSFFG